MLKNDKTIDLKQLIVKSKQSKHSITLELGTGTLADFNIFPVCHFELCWILVMKVKNVKTLKGRGGAAGGGGRPP